jgi:hypothetical protein
MGRFSHFLRGFLLVFAAMLISPQTGLAVPVVIGDVPGHGFNTSPPPGGYPEVIGCGPTSGVMILETFDNQGLTGGSPLITSPLADAWTMHDSYMGTDAFGFGPPSQFHFGVEQFALDRGWVVDAVIHVEPTTFNPADWPAYTVGPDLATDATFWDTSTWDINDSAFLAFLAVEIDAGRPVVMTVDSDGDGGDDHWMVGAGYDMATGQWAGYNTWDSSLHWYDVESAFIPGNTMGIGFIRTFAFIPEPGTAFLVGVGLIGFAGLRRKLVT